MMRCVKALVDRGGSDLAAGFPFEAFKAWCAKDFQRAREVISIAQTDEEIANGFLTTALLAGNFEQDAKEFAINYTDGRRLAGVFALGRVTHTELADTNTRLALFEELVSDNVDDALYANTLLATLEIAKNSPESDQDSLFRIVAKISKHPSPEVLHAFSQTLAHYPKQLTDRILVLVLDALRGLSPAQKGSLNALDVGLSQLLAGPESDRVIDFLTDYLPLNAEALKLSDLQSFTSSLRDNPTQLQKVLLAWMLIGNVVLCEGIAALFRNGEDKPYNFDTSISHLDSSEQTFVCRKIVGYLFTQPCTASSFLVCVLRQCSELVSQQVSELMLTVILRNYSGAAKAYLSSISPDDAAFTRIQPLLLESNDYLANLESVGTIKELHPSESARQTVMLKDFDQMQDARREAEKQSIFLNLVSRSVIAHGRKTLSYLGLENNREPMEMELHPHSFSFEVPRQEFLDPVSTSYLIRVLRSERRNI